MPPQFIRPLRIVVVVLLPILLILGSVRLLAADEYLAFEYGRAAFRPDPFGFSHDQRVTYAAANFRDVREAQPIDALASQQLSNATLYKGRELKHMQDAQNVYQAVRSAIGLARPALATARADCNRSCSPFHL